MVTLVERSTTLAADEAEEISKAASTALTLCASVAVSQARIAAWVTQIQCHLWLQQASVTEMARKVLLDAPISPDGLFGPQFHAMVESMKTAVEQADDIRQHVSWLQPAGRPQRHHARSSRSVHTGHSGSRGRKRRDAHSNRLGVGLVLRQLQGLRPTSPLPRHPRDRVSRRRVKGE